jgi:hypothetical protein
VRFPDSLAHPYVRRSSPFCETDSATAARVIAKANTPPLHRLQPFRQCGQRYPDTSVVRWYQALEGAPVHPLGLGAGTVSAVVRNGISAELLNCVPSIVSMLSLHVVMVTNP